MFATLRRSYRAKLGLGDRQMRVVTYGAACSLDGFIAGRDGAIDWLHFSHDVYDVMAAYWATIDTMVMGRKTWDIMASQPADTTPGSSNSERVTAYVFSRTLREIDRPGVALVSSDPGAFVRDLKRRPGRGICVMGGGELATVLLEAGVVDEIALNIHPVLFGSGIPLFHDPGRRIGLTLDESRPIHGGCILASYRVRRSRRRGARALMANHSTDELEGS
jgi:dihydrofolate reductase